ncbi:LRP4 [Mytilus edulis]|uniref:LRP4 n=1 Tax=Mytilus edulis TaxID=6550 RepID=A0A8S3QWW0_MYTED|nr:LRP4 [Mytilus edulis]
MKKFDSAETAVGDEDGDQQQYEEIAEYVYNPSDEKRIRTNIQVGMNVVRVHLEIHKTRKVSQCDHEFERSLPNAGTGNHSVSTDKPISKCHTGFYGERCEAEETTKLLYSSTSSIWLLDVNSSMQIEIASTSNAIAIDYHKTKFFIYWTEVSPEKSQGKVRYPPTSNETTLEDIVLDNINTPDGIAVDSVNDHIYWTDTGLKE